MRYGVTVMHLHAAATRGRHDTMAHALTVTSSPATGAGHPLIKNNEASVTGEKEKAQLLSAALWHLSVTVTFQRQRSWSRHAVGKRSNEKEGKKGA